MKCSYSFGLVLLAVTAVSGCQDVKTSSYLHMLMGPTIDSPCRMIAKYGIKDAPGCTNDPIKDRFIFHYELWGSVHRSTVVYLASFTVQSHIFPDPDYGFELFRLEHDRVLLSDGKPFKIGLEQYFNELSPGDQEEHKLRMELAAKSVSVTSYSSKMYLKTDQCKFDNCLAPLFFLGSHAQLTRPFNGIYYGAVQQGHPFAKQMTIGGGTDELEPVLQDLDDLFVTIESGEPDRPQRKPSSLVFLEGQATTRTRGTINVEATSPYDSTMTASFAVFPEMTAEDYF